MLCRCVSQPQVCKQAAKALQHTGALSLDEGSDAIEVYPSQGVLLQAWPGRVCGGVQI